MYLTFVLFSPVTFAVFEANKSSSEMKKAGSAPLDQVVRFFFSSLVEKECQDSSLCSHTRVNK